MTHAYDPSDCSTWPEVASQTVAALCLGFSRQKIRTMLSEDPRLAVIVGNTVMVNLKRIKEILSENAFD